jgi:hypothetical protein
MELQIGPKDTEFRKNCLSGFLALLRTRSAQSLMNQMTNDEAEVTNHDEVRMSSAECGV